MEWISTLKGATVGLDTMPVIYFIESNPKYIDLVRSFFQAVDRGEVSVVTSMVTLLEVLVHPVRRGDTALAEQYRDILLTSKGMTTLPVSQSIAEEGAKLRASYAIRTPDAIQVATAIQAGARFFLTNDARLAILPHLQILTLDAVLAALPQDTDSTS